MKSTSRSTTLVTRAKTAVRSPSRKKSPSAKGMNFISGKSAAPDLPHPDVVIQDVDPLEIGAAVPPDQLVGEDRHPDPLGKLLGEHGDLPEGKERAATSRRPPAPTAIRAQPKALGGATPDRSQSRRAT